MTRAIITGITGFVGPYLARELHSRGIECVGITQGSPPYPHPVSLQDIRIHEVDIRNRSDVYNVLASENPDLLVHLAAVSHVPTSVSNPELTFDVNVGGTFNILEGLRRLGRKTRVLFISTGNLYGPVDSGESGFTESSPAQCTSPYATSKLVGEELARSYVHDFGMEVVIARPFNHTGPGQAPSFVCSEFARAVSAGMINGNDVVLHTGSLSPRRDFTDVRDIVRAYALLLEQGVSGEIYNVCSGRMIRIGDILSRLGTLANIDVRAELASAKVRQREIDRLGGDCSKLHARTGWKPEIPIEMTLRDLLSYWVQHDGKAVSATN
jgi:GDP-4-dehydro-6-deoxy-D-mannose reductase